MLTRENDSTKIDDEVVDTTFEKYGIQQNARTKMSNSYVIFLKTYEVNEI